MAVNVSTHTHTLCFLTTYIETQKLTVSSKYFPSGQLHPSAQSSPQVFAIESEEQECLQKEEHW